MADPPITVSGPAMLTVRHGTRYARDQAAVSTSGWP
jgi:hypothetical protein